MFSTTPVNRWITVDQVLPGGAFYDPSTGVDKPEYNGQKIYFDGYINEELQTRTIRWFTGMAGQAGTPDDILEYLNQPGGQTVDPYGFLFYNQMQTTPPVVAAPGIEYPSVNTIPLVLTLIDKQGQTLVENLPYSWNLSRLIYYQPSNARKGWTDLSYNLVNVDWRKSYVQIVGNGIPLQISGQILPEGTLVYRGPFTLKLYCLI